MILKRVSFIGVFLLTIIISLVGCGGGGSPKVSSKTIYDINGLSVSQLNGSNIYTMITAQPLSKPESNSGFPSTYNITFTTTVTGSSNYVASMISLKGFNSPMAQNHRSKQAGIDLIMREKENQALASRAKQFSRIAFRFNLSAPPSNIIVGTTWNNVHIAFNGSVINTTCGYISDHAYFFIDNRDTAAMTAYLASYGTAFDIIYNVNRARFGNENDTDTNGKVIIVFSRELTGGLLGYFYACDKYPASTFADSNEGDIFYMTTDTEYQNNIIKGTLAHEFQHMIYFDEHYNRGVVTTFTWLNEALSQAAEYYNGYLDNHSGWISNFLYGDWDGLSLTYWTIYNYGYGAIFIRYLIDQYGDAAIKNMCSTNKVGIAAVETATGADFNTIFNNFSRALVLSNTGETVDSRYNFTLDLSNVQPNGRTGLETSYLYNAGVTLIGNIYPYMLFFSRWTGNFESMVLTGNSLYGTVFGLSQ